MSIGRKVKWEGDGREMGRWYRVTKPFLSFLRGPRLSSQKSVHTCF